MKLMLVLNFKLIENTFHGFRRGNVFCKQPAKVTLLSLRKAGYRMQVPSEPFTFQGTSYCFQNTVSFPKR